MREIGKTKNCAETRRPKGRVFSNFSYKSVLVLPIFTSKTMQRYYYIHQDGKCFIFFYNIA